MLDGVPGDDESSKYTNMFTQWLRPQAHVTTGNPGESYRIVEGLLSISYPSQTGLISQDRPAWQSLDADAVGSMQVIRVSDVQKGKQLQATLRSFLAETERRESGPTWSGVRTESSPSHLTSHVRWSLFAVIKDFSQREGSNKLENNVPAWFRRRRLCSMHPALKSRQEVILQWKTGRHRLLDLCCMLNQLLTQYCILACKSLCRSVISMCAASLPFASGFPDNVHALTMSTEIDPLHQFGRCSLNLS